MNRKVFLALALILATGQVCFSQCLTGDCVNGTGKFDFGYAVYTGSFVDEKPHGLGTLDYGNGEKYTGEFINGSENGKGLLFHRNGSAEEVEYANGKILRKMAVNYVGGMKVEGCVVGDCRNGPGEVEFPSGNKYSGEFKDGMMHGSGKFQFAGGNVFEGDLYENALQKGTFTYNPERVTFEGDFYADGTPKSGIYQYASNDATVTIKDGEIIAVSNPAAEALAAQADAAANVTYTTCPRCSGKGIVGSSSTYSYTTPGTYTMSQFGQGRINLTNPVTTTSQGATFYNVCSECKGTKKIPSK